MSKKVEQQKLSKKDSIDLGVGGLMTGFGGLIGESAQQHQDRKTGHYDGEGLIIDTCYAPDTGYYETALSKEGINNGSWIIIEEYYDEKESTEGHNKWVKLFTSNDLPEEIKDIHSGEIFKT